MERAGKKVFSDKKGFTLAELLVVVAIIGILVSVSVPVFTEQAGKAKRAANQANLRAAKSAAVADYLTDNEDGDSVVYSYDVESGKVTPVEMIPSSLSKLDIDEASTKEVYEKIYVEIDSGVVAGSGALKNSDSETVALYAK